MFTFGKGLVVGRVVYRLVRSLKNPGAIEAAVREILPQIATLSSKLELIDTVGYRENVGHKLVSEAAAKSFEEDWSAELHGATAEDLTRESGLLWMLLYARRQATPTEPSVVISDLPGVTLAVLKSARTEVMSQGMGTRPPCQH
jgi:hypothetical protein